jgi:Fe-S-cluster containining protein
VFLSAEDAAALAAVKGVAPHEFEKMFCRWVLWTDADGKPVQRLSLRERTSSAGGRLSEDCVFWHGGCTVYEARPLQCRTYPFWSEVLASEKAWRETARSCPGIGQGAWHSLEEIESLLAQEREQRIITRAPYALRAN